MYYPFRCSLILLFLCSDHISCASSNQGLGWCVALFHCGNITTGFPFWGGDRHKPCGHPLLELHCNNNITSLFISSQEFYVLQIDRTSKTLALARADHLGSFCSSAFKTTTLPLEIFELSPAYKNLTVSYNCDPKHSYISNYTCPSLGVFSISESQYSCKDSFTVNVPMSFLPEERELNLTHLETALRKGFEVKLIIDELPCQECLSSGGRCGFNSTTQNCCNVTSPLGGVSCVPYQPTGDELYRRCGKLFSCGNQDDLSYPFWIPGREECGHPDFKLDCSGALAEFNIASVKFRILDSRYYSGMYTIARSDYIGDLCPTNPLNAEVTESILQLTYKTELLTLYYNCQFHSSAPFVSGYVGELGCDDGLSYYVTRNLSSPLLDEIRGLLNNFRSMCKRNVSIPASGSTLKTLQGSPTLDHLQDALEQGFELEFNNENCLMCTQYNGACGYNKTSTMFVCYCKDGSRNQQCYSYGSKLGINIAIVLIYIAIGVGSLTGIIILLVLLCPCFRVKIFRKRKTSDERRQEKLKALIPLKHYTYKQVKKMTKSFEEVVGRGGFGIVYRGTLSDGRMVAVKVLKESNGNNGEDFINEVASMSQTSHVNIVTLLGFCSEGSKRAIIYEFLVNGSLDRFISDKNLMNLDLASLYGIALGVARGLEYLHYGCKTRIVHFDIKPQNVLLDDSLCPKVSDFGLAKLCEKKESIMSLLDMRGTIGYIAPEMISRVYGSVSHKSDVYSYGMLVLEVLGTRRKERVDQNSASNASSLYFPEWIYKDLERLDSGKLIENGISIEEEEIAKKMILVGLWCIQSSPSNRPPMSRVVEMMEGSLEALEVPPRPVLQQIPAAPLSESIGVSEENSSSCEILVYSS